MNTNITFDQKSGNFVGITDAQRAIWRVQYPHADIDAEVVRAACWVLCNAHRARDLRTHLNTRMRFASRRASNAAAKAVAKAATL